MKAVEYKLLQETFQDINKAINDLLAKGWVLYGEPHFEEGFIYQAMVKVEQSQLGVPIIR